MTCPSRVAVVALSLVTLAGCSGSGADEPPAVSSSSTSLSSSTSSPTTPLSPEQRELTAQQVRVVLPQVQDLPGSWREVDVRDTSRLIAEPPECRDLYLRGEAAQGLRDDHLGVASAAAFTSGERRLEVSLLTFDEVVPQTVLEQAGQVVGPCSTHTVDLGDGPSDVAVSGLPVDEVGDQSLGLTTTTGGRPEQRLLVRSGHTLLVVVHRGAVDDPGALLHDVAQGMLDRVG
ncbi:hypothetical protein AWH69_03715 [Janibacter melonis]|uniref:PknH-like extracellular domain-containing protein n=1 Tax=Janibacter melonis TaxID=262209 RepID=A0A176QGE1_9MICO|nr:hypothetical protein [Janibacter melonis]OAB88885.1 hypothetical protein AWH69_03715 [Janibacter melonis]